jgi:uncharacterized membrane protein (DUF4010 family)
MPTESFNHRLVRVMEARAAIAQRSNNTLPAQIAAIAFAILGASAAFFLLKAGTLAYFGREEFSALTAPLTGADAVIASAGFGQWLGGIDPITEVLARTLRPDL